MRSKTTRLHAAASESFATTQQGKRGYMTLPPCPLRRSLPSSNVHGIPRGHETGVVAARPTRTDPHQAQEPQTLARRTPRNIKNGVADTIRSYDTTRSYEARRSPHVPYIVRAWAVWVVGAVTGRPALPRTRRGGGLVVQRPAASAVAASRSGPRFPSLPAGVLVVRPAAVPPDSTQPEWGRRTTPADQRNKQKRPRLGGSRVRDGTA